MKQKKKDTAKLFIKTSSYMEPSYLEKVYCSKYMYVQLTVGSFLSLINAVFYFGKYLI